MKKRAKPVWCKVAEDLFRMHLVWTVIYFGVLLMLHLVLPPLVRFAGGQTGLGQISLFEKVQSSATVYLLVAGIVTSSSMMSYFVGLGVTRRDYFLGATLEGVILSAGILVSALGASLVPGIARAGSALSMGAALPAWILLCYLYYCLGLLISAGFCRPGLFSGPWSLVLALLVAGIADLFWEGGLRVGRSLLTVLDLPAGGLLTSSLPVLLVARVGVIALVLVILRVVTWRIPLRVHD
ncbi:hypothetical protein AU468_11150 [Alkalispirochaeta sphaeroplastigenens]|uniref:Uncharacterized protein n=1 Tax=Alkalispirochaeta sphaeroplastigenens TaxID=1187066 RepID=A0A2S4JHE3_9SPIO|nr:hypothetical protein [Alkalispirochaeta sphaeroplastigenens]POQ98946.1 hypothetical protein AU468_11150 [Alkalispirochaeta sphaeroplastigenens]